MAANPANSVDVGKIKLVWRGTYNNSTSYEVDDLVVYDDGLSVTSYICIADTTGNVPSSSGSVNTTYWNISAKGSSSQSDGTTDGQVQFKSGTGFGADSLFIFDTVTNRLGINTDSPTSTLDVDGLTTTTNLEVVNNSNISGISTFSDTLNVSEVIQNINIVAGTANGTSDIDVKTSSVWVFTSDSSSTWTHNIRGDGSTTLDSMMSVGQVLTVKIVSKQNNSSYYSANITIDGAAQTEYWKGFVPSSGASTGYNTYSWTIVKTGSNSFVVFASQN